MLGPDRIKNCPELGYCALPLIGLEVDWGGVGGDIVS